MERMGIRIFYEDTEDGFRARFFIGKGTSGKTFVTNAAIRTAVENAHYRLDEYLGQMEVVYEPHKNTVYWRYHPFGRDKDFRRFPRVGAADLLELFVSKEIKNRLSKDAKIVHYNPEGPRQLQLNNRGITAKLMADGYSQKQNLKLLRQKIAKDHAAHSPKYRKPKP